MFEGIAEDEILGEYGFGGGASGDEIDKCDYGIGSPYNAIVVATSTGHPNAYAMFPEDVIIPFQDVLGTQTREVRSDVTYYESGGGGGHLQCREHELALLTRMGPLPEQHCSSYWKCAEGICVQAQVTIMVIVVLQPATRCTASKQE